MLGAILTGIIGTVARGAAAKAIASGVGGALVGSQLPTVFIDGLLSGLTPEVRNAGVVIGGTIIGGAINAFLTYWAPKNT